MYTTKEAAQELGYASAAVIRLMIKQGRLKAERFGHVWMIRDSEVARVRKIRQKRVTIR